MRLLLACSGALLLFLVACGSGGDQQQQQEPRAADASGDSSPAPAARAVTPVPDSQVVAVQVGRQEEVDADACSVGAIRGGASGSRAVGVRSGPGERFPAVDSLPSGATFHWCDGSADGWVGIVYRKESDPPDTTGNCGGLSSPIAPRRAYRGPCRSGWVRSAEQEVIAG